MNALRRVFLLPKTSEFISFSIRSGGGACYSGLAQEGTSSALDQQAISYEVSSNLVEGEDVRDPLHARKLREALQVPVHPAKSAYEASLSEKESFLGILRLHNSSLKVQGGHMIKARVIEVDKKKLTLDTGIKIAKISVADITPDCILHRKHEPDAPRQSQGEVRPGDIVQVYLEHEESPEGDMLVSGQQAAVRKRVRTVWKELQTCMKEGKTVKGRVLNSVSGGFAVGVGGLVCFVPLSGMSSSTARHIGELQDFRVVQMTLSRSNVVLEDNKLHLGLTRTMGQQNFRRRQPAKVMREVVVQADVMHQELGGTKSNRTSSETS